MNAADLPRIGLAESIELLESMPGFLDAAIDATPPGDLGSRPGAEEFSLLEHACHLRDLEREGYLVRVRRELTALLAPVTAGDLRREARFGDQAVCLADLVAMMVEHDRGHRDEIERLVEELEE